jgi:predicted DNA-binding transcriptional regulator YafY
MNRLDRALAILLLLRGGKMIPAAELARKLEVSVRTIYRDVDALCAIGVPVYAEMGRSGGFRLSEGYFLPPVMFTTGEAVSLLLGLAFLRSLPSRPFISAVETGEQKLLAAIPSNLRAILAEAQKVIGFEGAPGDIFHPEPAESLNNKTPQLLAQESETISIFLQAVLDRQMLLFDYRSSYSGRKYRFQAVPQGIFWDRNRWYLVGKRMGYGEPEGEQGTGIWRADRVVALKTLSQPASSAEDFDVRKMMGRNWLRPAMQEWKQEAPVQIKLTLEQAECLKKDWYYQHASFERISETEVLMMFGESNREVVFQLLRWLGPGAKLIRPPEWQEAFMAELDEMRASYR